MEGRGPSKIVKLSPVIDEPRAYGSLQEALGSHSFLQGDLCEVPGPDGQRRILCRWRVTLSGWLKRQGLDDTGMLIVGFIEVPGGETIVGHYWDLLEERAGASPGNPKGRSRFALIPRRRMRGPEGRREGSRIRD